MIDFASWVSALWVLYVIVNWLYVKFTFVYLAERILVLDKPPVVQPKNLKRIPIQAGDWLKVFSHEYDQKFIVWYTRPLTQNVYEAVRNVYPTLIDRGVNLGSPYSSIELWRNDFKVWALYLYEADGLV